MAKKETVQEAIIVAPIEEKKAAVMETVLADLDSHQIEKAPEPVKVTSAKPMMVTVMPVRDYSGSIGGVRYFLQKGKSSLVPEHVKRFLAKNKQNPIIAG